MFSCDYFYQRSVCRSMPHRAQSERHVHVWCDVLCVLRTTLVDEGHRSGILSCFNHWLIEAVADVEHRRGCGWTAARRVRQRHPGGARQGTTDLSDVGACIWMIFGMKNNINKLLQMIL